MGAAEVAIRLQSGLNTPCAVPTGLGTRHHSPLVGACGLPVRSIHGMHHGLVHNHCRCKGRVAKLLQDMKIPLAALIQLCGKGLPRMSIAQPPARFMLSTTPHRRPGGLHCGPAVPRLRQRPGPNHPQRLRPARSVPQARPQPAAARGRLPLRQAAHPLTARQDSAAGLRLTSVRGVGRGANVGLRARQALRTRISLLRAAWAHAHHASSRRPA